MVDLAMELLKNVTSDGGFKGDYSLIVPACFVIPDEAGRENSEVVDFNWSTAEPMASEEAFLQVWFLDVEFFQQKILIVFIFSANTTWRSIISFCDSTRRREIA